MIWAIYYSKSNHVTLPTRVGPHTFRPLQSESVSNARDIPTWTRSILIKLSCTLPLTSSPSHHSNMNLTIFNQTLKLLFNRIKKREWKIKANKKPVNICITVSAPYHYIIVLLNINQITYIYSGSHYSHSISMWFSWIFMIHAHVQRWLRQPFLQPPPAKREAAP